MSLEVLLGGSDELDGDKLITESCLFYEQKPENYQKYQRHGLTRGQRLTHPRFSKREMMGPTRPRFAEAMSVPAC